MKSHFGVVVKELLHRFGFVGGEIVEHDMDFSRPLGLLDYDSHELDEVGAGMPLGSSASHLARFHVEGGIEGKRAVTEILEAMPLGSSRGQRQHWIQPAKA
jgi:hypothetical protein